MKYYGTVLERVSDVSETILPGIHYQTYFNGSVKYTVLVSAVCYQYVQGCKFPSETSQEARETAVVRGTFPHWF